jgi:glycosyltransferase involved in cell wall biosynthesis
MKVILTQPFLHTKGGLERVVLEIAKKYNPIIYTYRYVPQNTFEEFKEFDIRIVKPKLTLPASLMGERIKWGIQSGECFNNLKIKEDYDVLNAHGTPSEWARNKNERMCWYCHSPNREAFDLYEWRMKNRNLIGKMMFKTSIEFYKHFEFKTVPKIESVLTNSINSQIRIRKYLKREAKIIHPGVDVNTFENESYKNYFFYPSRITPEKNFEMAIESFEKLRRENEKYKKYELIIAGSIQKERKEHMKYLEKLQRIKKENVKILIDVSEEKLIELYKNCLCVLFTPLNEDFGIVPLEAMSCEKPVIAINEGGPKETVIHGETGYLVNDVNEMVEYMKQLCDDMNVVEEMGKMGRRRVIENFTWEKYIRKIDHEFDMVKKK